MSDNFDLTEYLLGVVYSGMSEEDMLTWCPADAAALASDLREFYGINCDPDEIYETIEEFIQQDECDAL